MRREIPDECKKLPPETAESSKSDAYGGNRQHTADRKIPAAQRLRQQQRQQAYSNKISEILNRINKTTPCPTVTQDNNQKRKKGTANQDGARGPQYTFDNYDDGTVVDEDLENKNRTEKLDPRTINFEDGPEYILESSDFYEEDEAEVSGGGNAISAVGKASPAVESHPVMPGYASANAEYSTCQRTVTFNNNLNTISNIPICQNSSDTSQQHEPQRLRQQKRLQAYSNKLSEMLNRIHKESPSSAVTQDNNKKEKTGQTIWGDASGPQYTFDNYDDETVVAEDLESNNRKEQLEPRSIRFEDCPRNILESSDFYKDEETGDGGAVSAGGKVSTIKQNPIMPGHASANGEDSICQQIASLNDNVKTKNTPYTSQRQDEESELNIRPGAVAVGSDSHESYRSFFNGTRTRSRWGILRRLQTPVPSQIGMSDLSSSYYSRNPNDSKEISPPSVQTAQQQCQFHEALQAYRVESTRPTTPVIAEVVDTKANQKTYVRILSIGLVLIAGIIVLIILLTKKSQDNDRYSVAPTPSPTPSTTKMLKSTIETVLEKGVLKCGITKHLQNFAILNSTTGEYEGFEIDSCRAVAAAVMGANYSIETIEGTLEERFLPLTNRSVDLLVDRVTHTMERDVLEKESAIGFSFSVPYLYDGLGFVGREPFVSCADGTGTAKDCSELKICVIEYSTHYQIIADLFPGKLIVTSSGSIDSVAKFINDECNVIADEKTARSEQYIRAQGYNGTYVAGKTILSKEPLAIVTRSDDHEWSRVVNWVLQAQFLAEAMNITQDTAGDFSIISPFGDKYNTMFSNAIAAVGNYGERYERYFEMILPREGLNRLYLGKKPTSDSHSTNGLIFSYPFGPIDNYGPEPTIGSRLNKISERSVLRCGITEIRDGFARFDTERQEWKGLDIDYCNAIAAAMFGGVIDSTIEYVNLTTKSLFRSLIDYDVDIVCGVGVDIEANIEMGISFSQPYFYEGE